MVLPVLPDRAVVDSQVDKENTCHSPLVGGMAHVAIAEDLQVLSGKRALDAYHTVLHRKEEIWLDNRNKVHETDCLLLLKVVLQQRLDHQKSFLLRRALVLGRHVHLTILHHYSSDPQ